VFSNKNKILTIEINAEKINKEICRLILHIEHNIINLKGILENGQPGDRDEELKNLYSNVLKIRRDFELVSGDIKSIVNEEMQSKDLIKLNDKGFLNDKMLQIRKIKEHLDDAIEILENRPTDREFRGDLISTMIIDINHIIEGVNGIVNDDKELDKLYQILMPK
jgi:hypothetical protein